MRTYSLEMLQRPDIYELDADLATLARKAAVEAYQAVEPGIISLGDWKRQFLSGEHASVVFDYQNRVHAVQMAAEAETKRLLTLVETLTPPVGVTVTRSEACLKIKAPFDGGNLNRRLNRLGGHWDEWEKCSVVPLSAVEKLPKIFANWAKAQGIAQQTKAAAEVQRQSAQEKKRREREAAWQAERQRDNAQRKAAEKAESDRRAKAVASRRQVIAGQYRIGDILDGRQITGFGKSWTEATLKGGQLYQPCDYGRCENEPVCVHCEKCSKHCTCDSETYCYAYFE